LLNFEFNTLIITALGVFGLGFSLQMVYWWGIFARLAFYKTTKKELPPQDSVSVVICARNEYSNLRQNIPLFLAQQYPNFEVVVVNDCSDDDSEGYLAEMARHDTRLKVVHLRQSLNFFQGKKFPLSMGIKSAKNEILLLTDADCRPESEQWISHMVKPYNTQVDIVLGYGPYEPKKGLLNKLIRLDTMHIGIQYLSLALARKPYMGVGRNLSYRKQLFIQNKGFTSHYNIASGDDDLFVSQVAHKGNTQIVVEKGARTYSVPKKTFFEWAQQKRRHFSTAKFYSKTNKTILGTYYLSQMLFYAGFVWLLVLPFSPLPAIGGFILRLFTQLFITKACMKQLGEKDLLLFSPFGEVLLIVFNLILAAINQIKKRKTWN
jgi:glycosyltransferase involved in cell wall biosynthesis